jgi:hypothetical protein
MENRKWKMKKAHAHKANEIARFPESENREWKIATRNAQS